MCIIILDVLSLKVTVPNLLAAVVLTRINLYFIYIVNNIVHLIIWFLYLDTYKLEKTKTLFNLYFCSIYLFVLFT